MHKINYFKELIEYDALPNQLSDEELYNCFLEMKNGNNDARKKIIEHNLKFVLYEVNLKFSNGLCDVDDLISNGIIGLIKAVDSYDINRNCKFITYAFRCIDNQIRMSFRNEKKFLNIISLDDNLYQEDDSNRLIRDVIIDDTDKYEKIFTNDEYLIIRKVVDSLPIKEKNIIKMYFGFNGKVYSQKELAEVVGLSQSYLSRTICKILNKITYKLYQFDIVDKKYIKTK